MQIAEMQAMSRSAAEDNFDSIMKREETSIVLIYRALTAWLRPLKHRFTSAGNHAFARAYIKLVPDTWHVINDRDAVPRIGKLLFLFKRPGHRVSS